MKPSGSDLAYAAGLLDGEGCVSICKASPADYRNPRFWLQVSLSNTDRRMVDWLAATYGGSVTEQKVQGNRRPCWRWTRRGRAGADFLRAVLPYLIVKRSQALIGIELAERVSAWPKGCVPLTAKEVARRDELRVAITSEKRA